jgi:hypothetical protein
MPCNASYARFIFGKCFTSTIILYALLFAQNFYSCKKWVLQCVWIKKSCLTALARTRLASHSVCTFPRARSKATDPSSHMAMAPSLLSSSLSRARSGPYNSMTTAFEGDGALHQSTSRDQCHNKKQAQASASIEENPT